MADSYDAWLLDLDGTLYHPTPVKLAMAVELALFGWGVVGAIRRFRSEHELLRAEDLPVLESPYRTQLERTAAALGLETSKLEAVIASWMQERPGKWIRAFRRSALLLELEAFRGAGGKTALVSDYPARAKLRALGVDALFDVVVASGEPGGPRHLKPNPDGYRTAAERLGVSPARCLVLGDRADADGLAAEALGMAFRLVR